MTYLNHGLWLLVAVVSLTLLIALIYDMNQRSNLKEDVINFPFLLVNITWSYIIDRHIDGEIDIYSIYNYVEWNAGESPRFVKHQSKFDIAYQNAKDEQNIYWANYNKPEDKDSMKELIQRKR